LRACEYPENWNGCWLARPLLSLVTVVTNSGHLLGYFRALQRALIIDSDLRFVDSDLGPSVARVPRSGDESGQTPPPCGLCNSRFQDFRQCPKTVVLQVSNADKFVAERLSCVLRLPNRKGCR
jgi:hypothetical protein